jgi:hypothetical protein
MRHLVLLLTVVVLAGCAPAPPPPAPKAAVDPTTEAWYGKAVAEVAALAKQAEADYAAGRPDAASTSITKGQPIAAKLLAVPRPTLAALEAASDLDQLYARMLLANKNIGWARLEFQKNVIRWRLWEPKTGDSARRLKLAEAGIAECDRRLAE